MIAVIFEVLPRETRSDDYLSLAADLRRQLENIDGFLSIERFESLATPGRILSLSFWRDEESLTQWRNLPEHRAAQAAGRNSIFEDYRLRVTTVVRDYGMHDRTQAPADSCKAHSPGL
jgi:heme-degrading monooxygenase HmoA